MDLTGQTQQIRFDDALPAIARAIHARWPKTLDAAVFLRAVDGLITVVVPEECGDCQFRSELSKAIIVAGGAYVDPKGACAIATDLFEPDLLRNEEIFTETVRAKDGTPEIRARVLDRRVIGQDWTRPIFAPISDAPPVVSFFSCKGGVGRSTALAIAAAGFAASGQNVLIVDLDMEAPGLGVLLLDRLDRPEYGALDFLVENGISGVDLAFVRSCIAPSPLTSGSGGVVDVLPAVGRRGIEYPENLIPKLGRALLDDPAAPLVAQVRDLISSAAKTKTYDAIFVDVRAGLSESSAAALLSLGGYMLLFGVDTNQTFEAYQYLFAHLRRYATGSDWRARLQMVQAKSSDRVDDLRGFRERASDLFSEFLYDNVEPGTPSSEAFNFDVEDDLAPHFAWSVQFDPAYVRFDPVTQPHQLDRDRFDRAFGDFVDRLRKLVRAGEAAP